MKNGLTKLLTVILIYLLWFNTNVFSSPISQPVTLKAKTVGFICHKVRRGQMSDLIDFLNDEKIYMDSLALYNQINCVDSGNNVDHLLLTAVKSKEAQAVEKFLQYISHRGKYTKNKKLLQEILNNRYAIDNKPLLDWVIEKRKLERMSNTNFYVGLEKLFRSYGAKECAKYKFTQSGFTCNRWK